VSDTRRGRPRDPEAQRRILAAAATELQQRGYDAMSVERVAAEAGVAKTTLYRRWPTKAQLVVALITELRAEVPFRPTGDHHRDLATLVGAVAKSLSDAPPALIADLLAAAVRDRRVGDSVRSLWAERHRAVTTVVAQAQAAGLTDDSVPPAVLVDQLVGPLYYRLLVTGEPIDPEYARTLVRSVLRPTDVEETER
jgi:AcrR family transcriptional regulator